MNADERQALIEELFEILVQSAFAEGCESRIANSLAAKFDDELETLYLHLTGMKY